MADPVVTVRGLHKRYGAVEAVRGIDLDVRAGEIFAFLGPNGAGKTTTVEILEGYRTATAGEVEVLGEDPSRAPRAWRARIGIVLQSGKLPPEYTVRETLSLHAAYYPHPMPVGEIINRVGLDAEADRRAGKLSGGQQRRLEVALALVGDPELLFLDEPTTGFDPAARRAAWGVISGLRELGKTIFLTTHYLEEAEALADRVAIIRDGRIVAEGSPAALTAGDDRAEISFGLPVGATAADLPDLGAQPESVDQLVRVRPPDVVRALHTLTGWALERHVELAHLTVRRARLEDVYLDLTGDAT